MWSGFFYWYGPDVSNEDNTASLGQYNDYITTGGYKEGEEYL